MTNVLIVDDHALIREGLKRICHEQQDLKVVGEAGNAADALQFAKQMESGVVVLDLSLPDRNGFDLIKDIKSQFPMLQILVLSMYPEQSFGVRAIRAGADGYVVKSTAACEIVKAIRGLAEGGKYLTPLLADQLVDHCRGDNSRTAAEKCHQILSDREFEVLRMIANGKTVSRIAQESNLSVSTVNTYRTRVLEKLNLKTTAELIHYAVKNDLVM